MRNTDFEYEMKKVAWLRHVIRELEADKGTVQKAVEAEFGRRGIKEYSSAAVEGRLQERPSEVYDPQKVFADFDPYALADRGLLSIPKGKFEESIGLQKGDLKRYMTIMDDGSTVLYVVAKPAIAKADIDAVKKSVGAYARI
ncbi:MAG TPA: hypothetical protein VI968_04330 [archaeon]|nr:hypothetical protein [archaeon]